MTIVREYEDEEYGPGVAVRPQFRRMMEEAKYEGKRLGAIIAYDRSRFAGARAVL